MKKRILFILLSVFAITSFANEYNFSAKEIFVGYYISDAYANVIEYDVCHDNNSTDISNDIQTLINTVKNADYTKNKYSYKYFQAAEESISNEGKFVKINLDLLTNQNPSLEVIQDLFSKTLKREVSVKIENDKINMYFDATGIEIRSTNSEAYQKDSTIMLSWSNQLSKMELVFGLENNCEQNILKYVNGKISSPEKTAEEIDYMKNSSPPLEKNEQQYQDDCDIVRLQHLMYYGKLIEEYKEKTGKYPFEGENQQVYAFIYNKKQKKYCSDTNPYKHIQITPKDFFEELEKGLGREIEQLYDPQYVPSGRPIFYIYMIDQNQYFFAIHLSKYYPFAKKVASNYYKVELSNVSDKQYKFYTVQDLEINQIYKAATAKQLSGYFEQRKNKHIREYK